MMAKPASRIFLATLLLPLLLMATGCDGFFATDHAAGARQAYAAGNFREARIHLINQLRQDPGNGGASMMLARTLLEMGDGIGAQARLEKLTDDPQYGAEAAALMTHALVASDKHEQVLELTGTINGPYAALLAWSRASSLFALDRGEEAKHAIEQGLALAPGNLELSLLKGTSLLAEGRQKEARAIAGQYAASDESHPLALLFAGRVARLDGDERGAQELLARALEKRPQHPQLLKELGDSYRQTADPGKARDFYQRSLALAPNNADTLLSLAELEFFEGDRELALQIVQENERLVESVPEGVRLAGLIAEDRGNHEFALAKLRRYLRDNPDEPISTAALARIYDVLKEPALAAEARRKVEQFESGAGVLGEAIRTASAGERAKIDLAEKAITDRRWKEADGHYSALLANADMRNPVVFNNAAMVKLNLGDEAGALALAEQAHRLAPGDPFVQDSLGWALFLNGKDTRRAANLLTQAYETAPANFEIGWHFAQVLAQIGRRDDAVAVMERLKANADPADHDRIDQLIARL